MHNLDIAIKILIADQTCKRESDAAYEEADTDATDEIKSLEAAHKKEIALMKQQAEANLEKQLSELRKREQDLHQKRIKAAQDKFERDKLDHDKLIANIQRNMKAASEKAKKDLAKLTEEAAQLMKQAQDAADYEIKQDQEASEKKQYLEELEYNKTRDEESAR